MSSYGGYLDPVRDRTVSGWAFDPANPNHALPVEVIINGAHAGRAVANVFRRDLAELGMGSGHHGFMFPIPDAIGQVRTAEAYIAGQPHPLACSPLGLVDEHTNRPLPEEWKSGPSTYALPSFFILGAAKSGTTSLHYYLKECPGILMSDPKEPYFFEDEYERGATFYFNSYFSKWNGERVVGEARHRNLYLPWVAERIHAYNPAAGLIVILRNPVERAISHWWHWRHESAWRAEQLPLKDALAANLRRIETAPVQQLAHYKSVLELDRDGPFRMYVNEGGLRTYLDSGYYLDQIERYVRLFGRRRVHVVLLDDLIAAPQATVAGVLEFLGSNPRYAEQIEYPVCNRSVPGMMEHVDDGVVGWLKDHYAPHNERLAAFLGRPLACWDEPFHASLAASRGARVGV
jgi:hypothetical protein